MTTNKGALTAAALAAAGLLAAGGVAVANAASLSTSSVSAGYAAGYGAQQGNGAPQGYGGHLSRGGGRNDAAVTGDEFAKVKAAVAAKDSAVTIENVRKDLDGSYDVFGTKSGARVMLEVSKDLSTITTDADAGRGRGGGRNDAAVTGDEFAKVKAAVAAKDLAVTIENVRKDADGSYDVFGTKSGARVILEVSKDLSTITTHTGLGTGGPGGEGAHGGPGGANGPGGSNAMPAPTANSAT